jgi:hypothetical protein
LINNVEKKTFERGRIGPVSKAFTTAAFLLIQIDPFFPFGTGTVQLGNSAGARD